MGNNDRFEAPAYDCDVIMKGGITSGVVYPPALAEIATDHRLHGIGGTSAGAIAAAAAAAAELGRTSETGGVARPGQVPNELKQTDSRGRTLLFRLFQPQAATRSTFELIWNFRSRKGVFKSLGLLADLARMAAGVRPLKTPLTIAVAVVLAVAALLLAGPWSLIVGVPLVIIGVIIGGVLRLLDVAPARLADNSYGLCNGMTPEGANTPAVTDWLHEQIQILAGRRDGDVRPDERRRPVTFGDLQQSDIELVVLTTNISRGTSETIPFREQVWAFHPAEMQRLFPTDVAAHLVAKASTSDDTELTAELERLGLHLMPPSDELPIIVAARMSLSFPVLLSAVPLWGLTFERQTSEGAPEWKKTFVRNWFSDGGITSNLPVQLFDAVLPRWPTYGINLSGGADTTATNPAANVWRPISTGQGGLAPTVPITSIGSFLGGVFDTMQNWADNENSRAVGFRDRICTVRLGPSEGGMNLDMPAERIDELVKKGRCSGQNLASIQRGVMECRVGEPTESEAEIEANQWDRHRWIRFRMATSGLAAVMNGIKTRWTSVEGQPGYRELSESVTPNEPSWQAYRRDWSGSRSDGYRTALDAAFDADGLNEDWLIEGGPAGFAVAFGPDRDAGVVAPLVGGGG